MILPDIRFDKVQVSVVSGKENLIEWQLQLTNENLLNWAFSLYRSEGPDGPWDVITSGLVNQFFFVDDTVDNFHNYRTYWYQIKCTRDPQTFFLSKPACVMVQPELKALRMIEKNQLLLRVKIGTLCKLFIRRTIGVRCPNCWDDITKNRTLSDCMYCYNTGFLNGYFNPIETYVHLSKPTKSVQLGIWQEFQPQNSVAYMSNYPIINPRDIIYFPVRNIRWVVEESRPYVVRDYTISQSLRVTMVDRQYAEYELGQTVGV